MVGHGEGVKVPKVFVGQRAEEVEHELLLGLRGAIEGDERVAVERGQHVEKVEEITLALLEQRKYLQGVVGQDVGYLAYLAVRGPHADIGHTHRVLVGQTPIVDDFGFTGHLRKISTYWRRRDVEVNGISLAGLMGERDFPCFFLGTGRHLLKTIHTVGSGPHKQVAKAADDMCLAARVGSGLEETIELGIVVEAETHRSSPHGRTAEVYDAHRRSGRRGVVFGHVDGCLCRHLTQYLLFTLVFSQHGSIHQHTSAGRLVKPCNVQVGSRLAGTQKTPMTVHVGFHPGMVVVGVSPTGRVYLACRNADGAEGSHGEGALLTAASRGVLHAGHR